MKIYLCLICTLILMSGCVTTGKVALVSPTTPEEELKGHVRQTLDESKQPVEPTPQKQAVSPDEKSSEMNPPSGQDETVKEEKQTPEARQEEARTPVGETLVIDSDTALKALINVLEKKGLVGRAELLEEMKRLRGNGQ